MNKRIIFSTLLFLVFNVAVCVNASPANLVTIPLTVWNQSGSIEIDRPLLKHSKVLSTMLDFKRRQSEMPQDEGSCCNDYSLDAIIENIYHGLFDIGVKEFLAPQDLLDEISEFLSCIENKKDFDFKKFKKVEHILALLFVGDALDIQELVVAASSAFAKKICIVKKEVLLGLMKYDTCLFADTLAQDIFNENPEHFFLLAPECPSETTLTGLTGFAKFAKFSCDGKKIVSFSDDSLALASDRNTAKIWEMNDDGVWEGVDVFNGVGKPRQAEFSGDGNQVVVVASGYKVSVWDRVGSGNWQFRSVLDGHAKFVNSANFSSDSKNIVTSSHDGTVNVWGQDDVGDWVSVAILGSSEYFVTSAEFSSDGEKIVASLSHDVVRVWVRKIDDTWDCEGTLSGHTEWINFAKFSCDGKKIVTASDDRTVVVWALDENDDWESVGVLAEHSDEVKFAEFNCDGSSIVSYSKDRTAKIWEQNDSGSWNCVATIKYSGYIGSAKFSPDGRQVVVSFWSRENQAVVWAKGANGKWKHKATLVGHDAFVDSAEFSKDGRKILTASHDSTVKIWDVSFLFKPSLRYALFFILSDNDYLNFGKFSDDDKKFLVDVWRSFSSHMQENIPLGPTDISLKAFLDSDIEKWGL